MHEQSHIPHHKLLVRGQKVAHHIADDLSHRLRMKELPRNHEQHHNKGKERKNSIRSYAERIGVHFGTGKVFRKGFDMRPPLARWRGRGGQAGVRTLLFVGHDSRAGIKPRTPGRPRSSEWMVTK